jgi:hypothetical protein
VVIIKDTIKVVTTREAMGKVDIIKEVAIILLVDTTLMLKVVTTLDITVDFDYFTQLFYFF